MHQAVNNTPSSNVYHFCTYFDRNYLARGLALYDSLRRHCRRPFILWILCFDDETYAILGRLNLPGVRLIAQQEFEAGDEELARAKADRSRVEYYWTCTPSLPLYVLQHNPEVELITYLDADLYFYGDPEPIYEELGDGSILIVEHRYAPEYAHLATTSGIYNVGWMSFRRDEQALACLRWWRERCLEWCYRRVEDGKFGDQKYLDDWTERFPGVVVLRHKGAGLAPWNLCSYKITRAKNQIRVDGEPLLFFHFHALQQVGRRAYRASWDGYTLTTAQKVWLYEPYLHALGRAFREIKGVCPNFDDALDLPLRWQLRQALEGHADLLGMTRRLLIIRPVYRTLQSWYREVRYGNSSTG